MLSVTQISALEKLLPGQPVPRAVARARVLRGERFSWQVAVETEWPRYIRLGISTRLGGTVRAYTVRDAVMDHPRNPDTDSDYLADTPGLMPDILEPLEDRENVQLLHRGRTVFWLEAEIPPGQPAGEYAVEVSLLEGETSLGGCTMTLQVLPHTLPAQKLLFTQWFHTDCIATWHDVPVYSPAHWALIDKYMAMAAHVGINMLLTPVISPPLDTLPGTHRPNTQLVRMEKREGQYRFDFSLLERWIDMAHGHGIHSFEMSHLYSQWGAGFAPNIWVWEDGTEKHMFGWHTRADDPRYEAFLTAFLPALTAFLEKKGVAERCWFHLSDEPGGEHLDSYRRAHALVRPLLGRSPMLDALSHVEFWQEGLVEHPVCASDAIEPFLQRQVPDLWTYYCCAQGNLVGNRFLAMPASRNRILGLQLYKFGIQGFLHWGFNFYYSQLSRYPIDPGVTTSADGAFPSGDPFSVYPHKDGPRKSIRAEVFYQGLQDMRLCAALEEKLGREAVVALIDNAAGEPLTFSRYPRDSRFIPELMEKMKEILN